MVHNGQLSLSKWQPPSALMCGFYSAPQDSLCTALQGMRPPGELGVRSLPHRLGTQDALSAEEAPLEPPEGGVLFWKLCQVGLLVGLASRHQAFLPFGGSLTTEG